MKDKTAKKREHTMLSFVTRERRDETPPVNGRGRRGSELPYFATLTVLAALFLLPIALVLMNSLKSTLYISGEPFALPSAESFVGLRNYAEGLRMGGFFLAILRSLFISVASVALLGIACSMCAWYLARQESRLSKILYYSLIFGMVVPFQMVMYSSTLLIGKAGLNTVLGMPVVYLGFGASLTVFVLSGFVRSLPIAVEEAAMIDGCSPLGTFFRVALPLMRPSLISVSVLNAMWVWNDYLLPYLVLGSRRQTVPVAIQLSMTGAYGSTNLGGLMAMLILSMIPIVLFYLFGQKHILEGVSLGAVKG